MIQIGEILIDEKKAKVYVSPKKHESYAGGDIVLSPSDLDPAFINDLIASKGSDSFTEYCFYALLYLYLSLQRRVYFDQAVCLYGNEEAFPKTNDIKNFYRDLLVDFFNKKGYRFRLLHKNICLYKNKPGIPLSKIPKKEFFTVSGLKLCMIVLSSFAKAAYVDLFVKLSSFKKVALPTTKLTSISPLNTRGRSSCHFYKALWKGQSVFIKLGTGLNAEYDAAKRLIDRSSQTGIYVLPIQELSSEKCLVFPYISAPSLADIMKERPLDNEEYTLLVEFFERLLKDLGKCSVRHRDITPENILVSGEGSSMSFRLIDFGCSTVDGHITKCDPYTKRQSHYAGSFYRASSKESTDESSIKYILATIPRK